jgi:hypothetical protein
MSQPLDLPPDSTAVKPADSNLTDQPSCIKKWASLASCDSACGPGDTADQTFQRNYALFVGDTEVGKNPGCIMHDNFNLCFQGSERDKFQEHYMIEPRRWLRDTLPKTIKVNSLTDDELYYISSHFLRAAHDSESATAAKIRFEAVRLYDNHKMGDLFDSPEPHNLIEAENYMSGLDSRQLLSLIKKMNADLFPEYLHQEYDPPQVPVNDGPSMPLPVTSDDHLTYDARRREEVKSKRKDMRQQTLTEMRYPTEFSKSSHYEQVQVAQAYALQALTRKHPGMPLQTRYKIAEAIGFRSVGDSFHRDEFSLRDDIDARVSKTYYMHRKHRGRWGGHAQPFNRDYEGLGRQDYRWHAPRRWKPNWSRRYSREYSNYYRYR